MKMGPPNSADTRTPDPERAPAVPWRFADRVGRVLLCVALVWGLLSVIETIQVMRQPAGVELAEATNANFSAPANSLLGMLDGSWMFGGVPWQISIRDVNDDELTRLIDAEIRLSGAENPSGEFVFAWLQTLNTRTERQGDRTVYRVDRDDLRIAAFANLQHPQQIQLVRAARRKAEGGWSFLSASGERQHRAALTSQANLLPYCGAMDRLALRLNESDQLQGELLDLNTPFAGLRESWIREGWKVSLLEQTMEDRGSDRLFLCENGNTAVIACLVGESSRDHGMLLVVRSLH
jgi:hypothetical protein